MPAMAKPAATTDIQPVWCVVANLIDERPSQAAKCPPLLASLKYARPVCLRGPRGVPQRLDRG
jgi:hypothetical protein